MVNYEVNVNHVEKEASVITVNYEVDVNHVEEEASVITVNDEVDVNHVGDQASVITIGNELNVSLVPQNMHVNTAIMSTSNLDPVLSLTASTVTVSLIPMPIFPVDTS